MKYIVICADNYARETRAETQITVPMERLQADYYSKLLNESPQVGNDDYYIVVEETYQLWRGMKDLI